jgi:hypothetical protein
LTGLDSLAGIDNWYQPVSKHVQRISGTQSEEIVIRFLIQIKFAFQGNSDFFQTVFLNSQNSDR